MSFILTAENYHSKEANQKYLSVSQYKSFVGTMGQVGCEAQAMAKLNGEWEQENTTALLVGSYVDAHFEGTLDVFKAQNPNIFTKKGDLKAEYRKANDIINRIERDPLFMKYMSGEKQVIMTADLFGTTWKIKIDSYHPGTTIVDLKVMKSISDSFWVKDIGKMNFVEYWGYDLQLAIYQKIVELNTGKQLPVFIAVATKEKETDIEIIGIDQGKLNDTLSLVEGNVSRILGLKSGDLKPDRCEVCDYCKNTKFLTGPIHFSDLLVSV